MTLMSFLIYPLSSKLYKFLPAHSLQRHYLLDIGIICTLLRIILLSMGQHQKLSQWLIILFCIFGIAFLTSIKIVHSYKTEYSIKSKIEGKLISNIDKLN